MKTVSDAISRLAHYIMSLEFQQRFRCGLDEVQDGGVLEEERRILSMADRGDLANEGSKV